MTSKHLVASGVAVASISIGALLFAQETQLRKDANSQPAVLIVNPATVGVQPANFTDLLPTSPQITSITSNGIYATLFISFPGNVPETVGILFRDYRADGTPVSDWQVAASEVYLRDGASTLKWIDGGNLFASLWEPARPYVSQVAARAYIVYDRAADADGDLLANIEEEMVYGTDPTRDDSDADNIDDYNDLISIHPALFTHWDLNMEAGITAADKSGYARNAYLKNGVLWTAAGKFGAAVVLDGVNDYLAASKSAALSGTTDFTVAAWVKTTRADSQVIIQQRDQNGCNGEYMLTLDASGRPSFMIYGNSAYQFNFTATVAVNDDQWHHVAAVRKGTLGQIFVDGQLVGSASGTVRPLASTLSIGIGADIRDNNKYFQGTLDDVRIYSAALPQTTLAAIAQGADLVSPALNHDLDGDGLLDGDERVAGTDPFSADSDLDGVNDGQESVLGTNPLSADSDGDSFRDNDEHNLYHTDPKDAASNPRVLPAEWSNATPGSTTGDTLYYDNKFVISSASADIWGSADQCRFVSLPAIGDCQLTARIVSLGNTHTWAKAGVMVRTSNAADSAHAFMLMSPHNESVAETREYTAAETDAPYFSGETRDFPQWLRITRTGNAWTTFQSADGVTWEQTATGSADFGSSPRLGLAVTSTNVNATTIAVFDNVSVLRTLPAPAILPDAATFRDNCTITLSSDAGTAGGATQGAFAPNIRYTLDGSEPTESSALYTAPFTVTATTIIKAKAFPSSGTTVPTNGAVDKFASQYDGMIFVPATGTYTFFLDSDDQSQLLIDGTAVVTGHYNLGEVASAPLTLTSGLHAFSLRHVDSGGIARLILKWQGPEFTKQVVAKKYFFSQDEDFDRLSDLYETTVHGNLTVSDGTSDLDGDGYSEAAEVTDFLTNPNNGAIVPNNGTTVPGAIAPGLIATYYAQNDWLNALAVGSRPHYACDIVPAVNYLRTDGIFATSGRSDYVGASFQGFIEVPANGLYTFSLTSDDGSVLTIDNKTVINNNGIHAMTEARGSVALKAGLHRIRVDFFEAGGCSGLVLDWEGPGFPRSVVPASAFLCDYTALAPLQETADNDGDGISNADEIASGTNPNSADSDNDGLDDKIERELGSNPNSADGDNDGYSDWLEAMVYLSDLNSADIGTATAVTSVPGVSATSSSGFSADGSELVATARNGWAQYAINLPTAQPAARLTVTTRQDSMFIGAAPYFNLTLVVDGETVGMRPTLRQTLGATTAKATWVLPPLSTGSHTVKIIWNNSRPDTILAILGLNIDTLSGNWTTHRAEALAQVILPESSLTSPVCAEGPRAFLADLSTVSGYSSCGDAQAGAATEGTLVPPIFRKASDDKWFINLPLEEDSATALTFDLAGSQVARTVTWATTDLFARNGETITIRSGDSLKIAAAPIGVTVSDFNLAVADTNGVAENVQGTNESIVWTFEQAGSFTVTAIVNGVTETGSPVTQQATVKVKVVSSNFTSAPVCFKNTERRWTNTGIAPEAVLQADDSVRYFERQLDPTGRVIDLFPISTAPSYFTARLGSDTGPILDSVRINTISVSALDNTGSLVHIFSYADGTIVTVNRISLSEVPPDLRIHMHMFAAGITFEDGSIDKWFTASDFDANGNLTYRLLRSPDAATGNCHWADIYHGDELIKQH